MRKGVLMRTVKKFCLLLLSLLTVGCTATACEYLPEGFLPDIFGSSESDGEESSSSSASASSSTPDETDAQRAIVEAAYDLPVGASLDGVHTLTGVVSSVVTPYSSRGVTLIMKVAGRDLQCYRLKGTGAELIGVGDTITVKGTIKNYKGTVEFDAGCTLEAYVLAGGEGPEPKPENDPYASISKAEFYADYSPAASNTDAYYRSLNGLMSGSLTTPDQAPTISDYRPMQNDLYIRNGEMLYAEGGKAYIVVDAYGNEAFRVYEDGAYITLEEVAAYVYAFGTYPANYTASKNTDPSGSVWGEYLRVNHSSFSGDTSRFPYEPKLPNISGCGGDLNYFEMDIGTTGTDCDPSYVATVYNDGNRIVRGAARRVSCTRSAISTETAFTSAASSTFSTPTIITTISANT